MSFLKFATYTTTFWKQYSLLYTAPITKYSEITIFCQTWAIVSDMSLRWLLLVSLLRKDMNRFSIRQTETVVIEASAGGEWTFDFIEIMRYIYQFFRKWQIQFWKTFHNMVLCSVDCNYPKDFWPKRYLLELPRLKSFMCIILIQLFGTRRNH